MNPIEAFHHDLEIEERRSRSTVRAYVADVQMPQNWLDDKDHQSRAWEESSAPDLPGFLASIRPRPHRVHRLLVSWL